MAENSDNKILLHACCAICSGYPVSYLKDAGYQPIVHFYNPNIFPAEEYGKRLDAQRTLCAHYDCEFIEDEYETNAFHEFISGLEGEPEKGLRCDKCFELRLRKTAQRAKGLGIKKFSTSIVISPHKDFDKISQTGVKIADEFGLEYVAINFKKNDGFLKTNRISKELGLYRQTYCGCEYSKTNYSNKSTR